MDVVLSIILLFVVLAVVWAVARWILKITGCILHTVLVGIVAIGILAILFLFVF